MQGKRLPAEPHGEAFSGSVVLPFLTLSAVCRNPFTWFLVAVESAPRACGWVLRTSYLLVGWAPGRAQVG